MKVYGGVYYNEDGLSTSIRAMNAQTKLLGIINNNILGYNKVGYQSRQAVVSSFAEILGANAISEVQDDQTGRLTKTQRALDFAINGEGYFQYLSKDGIKVTKDGRFKIDKHGYLLTQQDEKVLSNSGEPMKFKTIPFALEDIHLLPSGDLMVMNNDTKELELQGTLGITAKNGAAVKEPDVRQGYVDASNVSLQTEFMNLIPVRRNFSANRQLFIIQNNILTQTIQQLGRS